jgi:ribonuclease HI
MWAIWSSRNKYAHEEIKYETVKSNEIVEELIRALEVTSIESVIQKENSIWCPPGPGVLKFNTDGSIDLARGVAGAGIVVRNHERDFVAAVCRRYKHIEDPFTIELIACRNAMLMAVQKNYPRVLVETDCQGMVEMWKKRNDRGLSGVHLIREMQLYEGSFQEFELVFARIGSNKATHLCAKEALKLVFSFKL